MNTIFALEQTPRQESEAELRDRIGNLAYNVTQNAATEYGFTGEYEDFLEKGLYVDIVSGEPLFISMDKYNSGCGWPAFEKPISDEAVTESTDLSHGMIRTEIRSSGADSHLANLLLHTSCYDSFVRNMTEINHTSLKRALLKSSTESELDEETEMPIRLYVLGTVQLTCKQIVGKYQVSPQVLAKVYELALPEPLRHYLLLVSERIAANILIMRRCAAILN